MKGLLITIEGIHGCGKSIVMSLLSKKLQGLGHQVVEIVDQQGTVIGREIRKINLKQRSVAIAPLTEALLIAATRHQNVVEIIKPNLALGKIVLCERFNDALFAFQGFGRGLDINILQCISTALADGIEPDLTILLDIDPRIALSRIEQKSRHRIEKEPIEFHERVREGYLTLAKKYPQRIKVFDATFPSDRVFRNVWKEIEDYLIYKKQ